MNHIETLKKTRATLNKRKRLWQSKLAQYETEFLSHAMKCAKKRISVLDRDIAALSSAIEDMERMEWLEVNASNEFGIYGFFPGSPYWSILSADAKHDESAFTLREAIDAAKKGEN